MHGIKKSNVGLSTILSLLKFSLFEGKADLDENKKPISGFEHDMFINIHTVLEEKNLSMEEKVLAGLVLTEIDSYDGRYLEVSANIKSQILTTYKTRMY